MFSTRALRQQALKLLAADPTTLAPAADANQMALVMNEINPGEALTFADCTLATFDGSTPLLCGLGTQPTGSDPFTDAEVVSLKAPAGGFRWETTGTTNLPQTIYGYVLLNNAMDTLLAAARFDNPIVLTAADQVIEGLNATMQLAANTIN